MLREYPSNPTLPQFLHHVCYSCGEMGHQRSQWIHKDKVCHKCNKTGHISKVCKSSNVGTINVKFEEMLYIQDDNQGDCFHVQGDAQMSCNSEVLYTVYDVHCVSTKEVTVSVKIGNKIVHMQLDTGCAYSLAPKTFYDQCLSNVPLKLTSVL